MVPWPVNPKFLKFDAEINGCGCEPPGQLTGSVGAWELMLSQWQLQIYFKEK